MLIIEDNWVEKDRDKGKHHLHVNNGSSNSDPYIQSEPQPREELLENVSKHFQVKKYGECYNNCVTGERN